MGKQTGEFGYARRLPGEWPHDVRHAIGKRFSGIARDIASPSRDPEPKRHRRSLNRQILQPAQIRAMAQVRAAATGWVPPVIVRIADTTQPVPIRSISETLIAGPGAHCPCFCMQHQGMTVACPQTGRRPQTGSATQSAPKPPRLNQTLGGGHHPGDLGLPHRATSPAGGSADTGSSGSPTRLLLLRSPCWRT
jgi:hypothetical protein